MSRKFNRTGRPKASEPYHYTQCGLDDVFLVSGFQIHETPYGSGVSIEDVEGLHKAIADNIVRNKGHLKGKEILFLRKLLDLTQADLALLLGSNVQAIARWEKDKSEINGAADKMIRLFYMAQRIGAIDVLEFVRELASLDIKRENAPQFFEETPDGWKTAA